MRQMIMAVMLLLTIGIVMAVDVNYNEVVQLPQLTSTRPLDTEGTYRTYLYCSWHIDGMGEEAIIMTNNICPETPVNFQFQDDETYYVRIDYADIGYGEVSHDWEIITTGNSGELTQDYNLNIPEPPQSLFDMISGIIMGYVRDALCTLFPFLGIC